MIITQQQAISLGWISSGDYGQSVLLPGSPIYYDTLEDPYLSAEVVNAQFNKEQAILLFDAGSDVGRVAQDSQDLRDYCLGGGLEERERELAIKEATTT